MAYPTTTKHHKLRWLMPVGLLCAVVLLGAAPAADAAKAARRVPSVTVSAFVVPPRLVATAGVGNTTTQVPALAPAPDGSNAEWVVVNGSHQDLLSITPAGIASIVAGDAFNADNGPPFNYASVDGDGYDWIIDNDQSGPDDTLYAVGGQGSASPGVNPVATFNGYAEDMTLGADGALYVSNNAGSVVRCAITAAPSAVCSTLPLSGSFDGGAYALGASGRLVWFTDAAGQLGALSSGGSLYGPYGDPSSNTGALSSIPGTIVEAGNGLMYAAAGMQSSGANTEIVAFDPSSPGALRVVASGLSNVGAMTIGPDGNVWFIDQGAGGGVGTIGVLNLADDAVTEYPLPADYTLPQVGARIAAGPDVPDAQGSGEVFFSATTTTTVEGAAAGSAAVGEVAGIPFPVVAGQLRFDPSAIVTKRRTAVLGLTCSGPSNARCAGRLVLTARVRPVGPASVATVRRLALGSVGYRLRGGGGFHRVLTLSPPAFWVLEDAAGHRLTVQIGVRIRFGTVNLRALALVGPKPIRYHARPLPRLRKR
ncbi:MAG: hypothetical protein ACP5H2_04315 [Solirubrobacteraceae bacterium]